MRSIFWGMLAGTFALSVTALFMAAQPAGRPGAQAAPEGTPLNYEVFKTQIEPVFLKDRGNGLRCVNCHSVLPTRLRLQPLDPGATSWTEEQSRQNFEVVSKLVTPGDPMKSRLLLHPLAPEAGGDPTHTGGKFWKSTDDPEWKMIADWVSSASPTTASAAPAVTLDFDFFKAKVEPIFLQKRGDHARCYTCHSSGSGHIFKLVKLDPGKTSWTDEESRTNFENTSHAVVPGDPTASTLLMHPLAPEAGGEPFHSGGRQFSSEDDPDWKIMAEWVRGDKLDASSGQTAAKTQ